MDAGQYAAAASRMHDRPLRGIWLAPPPHKRERPGVQPQASLENIGSGSSAVDSADPAKAQRSFVAVM
jgi:hypothetical protein